MERWVILVEGQRDRERLRRIVPPAIPILATYGTPNPGRLEFLRQFARRRRVVIFTDADRAGRRIRGMLGELFPDAVHLHTKPGFNGVENTPIEYLLERLRKAGVLTGSEGEGFGE